MLREKLQSPIMSFIAIIPILSFCSDWHTPQFQFTVYFMILTAQKRNPGSGGIRTHVPEETGAFFIYKARYAATITAFN